MLHIKCKIIIIFLMIIIFAVSRKYENSNINHGTEPNTKEIKTSSQEGTKESGMEDMEKLRKENACMKYETKEQALEYATHVFDEEYPEIDLGKFDIKVEESTGQDNWIVYVIPRAQNKPVKGGGGPSIEFQKSDGSIIRIGLQK